MLNRNGEKWVSLPYSWIWLKKKKAFSFHLKYYVHCGFVINGFYYVEKCSLYLPTLVKFYHEWMLNFTKIFWPLLRWWYDFCLFFLLMWYITLVCVCRPSLLPWNESNLIMVYDRFCCYCCCCCWIWFVDILSFSKYIQGICLSSFSFLMESLYGFEVYKGDEWLHRWIWSVPFSLIFWNSLRRTSLYVLVRFPSESFCGLDFCFVRSFIITIIIIDSVSLLVIGISFKIPFFLIQFWQGIYFETHSLLI